MKLSSEAVKGREQINLSSPQESVEDDREKGKADNLHIPDSTTLSTSEDKADDIQVEPPVIEVKKTDETPELDLPVHDNVKLEKESTIVAEVGATATVADETQHRESQSTEPVSEATELPVIAFLEKSIQEEFDASDNVKSPPEEQPTAEVTKRESLEVPAATASAKKVEEQTSDAVGLPKVEVESSGDTVGSQEKEKPAVFVQFAKVPEKVEIVPEPVEEVEDKKPKIDDNPELSVAADSGEGPVEAEEKPATEFVSLEKEPNKEPEISVPEKPVEPPQKEAQPIEVVPVKEPVEDVEKEIIETVEPPAEKEHPVEVHSIKGLDEVIVKEISEPVEVPKEKEQASVVDPQQESREVVETGISETVEVPKENELLVEVHLAKEQAVIAKETSESTEPLKNEESPDEVLSQKESVEVIAKEVTASFEPPKNKEQVDEDFSVTESEEVKEKETSASTLGSEEVEKQVHEVIVVKDGIEELPEITKHVQDTYVEAETMKDENALTPRNDNSPPIEEGNIQKEEAQHTEESDKQDSVGEVAKSGPIEDSGKDLEKDQPATEFVNVEKETNGEPGRTTYVPEESMEPPKNQAQPVEIVQVKEPEEVVAKEVIETVQSLTEKEQPVVIASESIELLEKKEQLDEVLSQKELVEVIAKEVSASFDLPKNNEQADEDFPVADSDKGLEKEQPAEEDISLGKEPREELKTTPVPNLSVEPPKKEDSPIEVLPVEEQLEVVEKEIIETVDPSTEKEQPIEVLPLQELTEVKEKEITEPAGLPKEKEQTEVRPVKELEVTVEDTRESFEPPKNKEQADEVLSQKESLEVIAKEVNASFEPPKNKDQVDEGFPVTKSGEVNGKETSDSTLGSKELLKQEPEVIEVTDGMGELPEITKHVQETYVEVETVKHEKALTLGDDINPPSEGGKPQEEEVPCAAESDKQVTEGQMAKSGPIENFGTGLEKEQLAEEFVSVDKEPREEPETTCVPELSVEPPKKEEQLIEISPVEQEDVIEEKYIESIELPTEKEQPIEVHPLNGSRDVVEKEITEPKELPKEKEHAAEVQPVQESKEVMAGQSSESVEIPKQNELLIEVQPVKELEVVVEDTSESNEPPKNKEQPNEIPPEKEFGEVIAKEISEFSVPPKTTEQMNEGFPVTESEGVRAKEISGSKLDSEEFEKGEPEVTEVKDGKEELPEITNQVRNDDVEVETEVVVKGEGEKSLALGDDIVPPLKVGQIHKEEKQCTVESDRQDLLGQGAQPSVESAAGNSPHEVKEDEKKESKNINVVAKLSEGEAPAVEKVGKENAEKVVETDKEDEVTHEKIQELTLPREEVAPRDSETDTVEAVKSTDDQKTGEVVDRIAETKIEDSTKDEKPGLVETGNAEHVNETTKELQESELEVKDKETVITGGEVPKVSDKKEVPSKPSHKHSHNILSKVKQSLVKAKKAIIGKSPSSKTLTSEARDDIKVK